MMRMRFDEQLAQLNTEMILMGAMCEDAIRGAVQYLFGDDKSKTVAIEVERRIDQKERDIENLCMRLLLSQQPVARDLRMISSALKMISDMERIGDQAADIAEIAPMIRSNGAGFETHISDMASATIKMVSDSVDAFVKKDLEKAHAVMADDDIVDELFLKIKRELIKSVRSENIGSEEAEALLDLLMIAKYMERIGDHAENVAEWVIYSLTGKHGSLDESES